MRKWNLEDFDGWYYAHRGLHGDPDTPENSLAAFRKAVDNGYGAELDVHLLRDGNLAVFHDATLKRMCKKEGVIGNLTEADLKDYKLGRSQQTIPTLQQVLDIFNGKTPLIIELKTDENNAAALTPAVCNVLRTYPGPFCIESFDPRVLLWLKDNEPDILRGQLARNFMKSRGELSFAKAAAGSLILTAFLTKPDFIAYRFNERRSLGNRFQLEVMKRRGAAWTIRTQEDLQQAVSEGLWPIFEKIDPAKCQQMQDKAPRKEDKKT